jgi:mxaJ protein
MCSAFLSCITRSAFYMSGAPHNVLLVVWESLIGPLRRHACTTRVFVAALLFLLTFASTSRAAELKVCADPDALPFSNRNQQGFENKLAAMLARDMHADLTYTWQRLGRGFVRNFLNKSQCDLVLGIPSNFRQMLTTDPYYRSTYVFVTRKSRNLRLASFDDPRLRQMHVGVQIVGEEYAPPAIALGRRGLVANVVGFETATNASSVTDAVLKGKVDTAVEWGPLAGYFARKHPGALQLDPVPEVDIPALPFTFMISMGVRKGNTQLRDRLNQFIARRKPEIDQLLRSYGVPLLPISASDTAHQARAAR